jgi:hypothetical protein
MPVYPLPNGLQNPQRLAGLPLVLAGPILRRVEANQVSVWIATKGPTPITLDVFEGTTVRMHGSISGALDPAQIALGPNLSISCITATPVSGGQPLASGTVYTYNLSFGSSDLFAANILTTGGGLSAQQAIAYPDLNFTKPSFVLPATDLGTLRLTHASCRKAHAESLDALQIVNDQLRSSLNTPASRPQQLFLTGDQIYADDVADILLAMLTDAGDALLGSAEPLPVRTSTLTPKDLLPGQRRTLVEQAGFTLNIGATKSEQVGHSHLISLGEYLAMYLFSFSDTLWPTTLPTFNQIYPGDQNPGIFTEQQKTYSGKGITTRTVTTQHPLFARYQKQSTALLAFKKALASVRRALANTPTYMLLDDHEVTDDWYMNTAWMTSIFQNALGSSALPLRIIQNALTGYALCQHWGNRPVQLAAELPWQNFRSSIAQWVSGSFQNPGTLAANLSLPGGAAGPQKTANSILWSYAIRWSTHEVVAIDTRTRRGYPNPPALEPVLLRQDWALSEPLRDLAAAPALPAAGVSFVLVASPVVGIPVIDFFKRRALDDSAETFGRDVEALNFSAGSFDLILRGLANRIDAPARVVMLSGDVHFGYAARIEYWVASGFTTSSARLAVANLTSSALRNQTSDDGIKSTASLQANGYGVVLSVSPPSPMLRIAWSVPAGSDSPSNGKFNVGSIIVAAGDTARPALRAPIDAAFSSGNRLATIEDVDGAIAHYSSATSNVVPRSATRTSLIPSTGGASRGTVTPSPPLPLDKNLRATALIQAQNNAIANARRLSAGIQLVGVNNLGVITFGTADAQGNRPAVQELWWWLDEGSVLVNQVNSGQTPAPAQPFSRFEVPLIVGPMPALDRLK